MKIVDFFRCQDSRKYGRADGRIEVWILQDMIDKVFISLYACMLVSCIRMFVSCKLMFRMRMFRMLV